MLQHGFVRVAAALPRLRVADCAYNVECLLHLLDQAEQQAVQILVFPELSITGYTCGDLFHQPVLQKAATGALDYLLEESKRRFSGRSSVSSTPVGSLLKAKSEGANTVCSAAPSSLASSRTDCNASRNVL